MRLPVLIFGLCCLCFVTPSAAHETWLLPTDFAAPVHSAAVFELTSGMAFPAPEYAIRPERIARAGLRLGTVKTPLKEFKTADKFLRLTTSLPRAGLATIWVELHPRTLDLTDDKVDEYLDEIAATAAIREAWNRQRGRRAWRETYVKQAKTFIGVGDEARADLSWREPVGMPLELVPLTSPLELRVGHPPATFQLLAKGKPLAGAPVGLLAEGAAGRVFQTTDAEGRVTFPLEWAGRLMVFAVDLHLTKDQNSWASDFTTLTLSVRGK